MLALDEDNEITGGGYVRTEVVAKLFGVSVRRVQQITQEGIIKTEKVPGEGRKYDLVPTITAYIQHLNNKAKGKGHSEKEAKLKEQKLRAEIALKESQGELHKMKTEIAVGKYIDVNEVVLDYQKFFTTFKRFALGIPSRLVGIVGDKLEPLEARKAEKEMSAEVKRMLRAFTVAGHTGEEEENKPRKRRAKT